MTFDNAGAGFELIRLLAILLLVVGGILGYGGKKIVRLFFNDNSERTILIIKFVGLILAACGAVIIFII